MDPKRATTWAALSKTLALTILLTVLAGASEARIITIRWSNTEPSAVTGFRVYTRASGQSFGTPAYDGLPTAVAGVFSIPLTVSDVAGTYVTATAYNSAGESARSNELLFAVPVCGDAVLDAGEQCDDGNRTAGDGCSATCQVEAACGDAVLDAGEQCDDGNKTAGDGCSATCQIEAACGNAVLDAGEQCDDGNKNVGDGCNATCRIEACGNAILDAGEQCDDGNLIANDSCNATCKVVVCAYGQTTCTVCDGQPASATIYNTSPTTGTWNLAAVEIKALGSSVVAIDAAASSSPAAPGPATIAGFTTPTANDLIVAFVSYDASTAGTQSATVTGGGFTWSRIARSYLVGGDAEVWAATANGTLNGVSITATPGTTNVGLLKVIAFKNSSGIGLSAIANASTGAASVTLPGTAPGSWTFAVGMDYSNIGPRGYPAGQTKQQESSISGVGTMWVQSTTAPSGFGSACHDVAGPTSYCGDSAIDTANGEQCDDGNKTAGDGCSATCRTEAPIAACDDDFDNDGDGQTDYPADPGCTSLSDNDEVNVVASCGNRVLEAGEQCDDGNKTAGDGCDATCKIEACGNTVVDAGEQCDDGNKTAGDGCNATCKIEACGNAVLDAGEQCDDGNAVGGDGCDAQCTIELAGGVPYHFEVGGASWTDPSSGQQWSSDAAYATGGAITSTSGVAINKTSLDPLYWTRRVGAGSSGIHFRLPVSGLGPYRVRLHFAELGGEVTASGQRVFDVLLEGGVVGLKKLDVFSEAKGNRIALVKDVYVLVDDGALDIDLVPVAGLPPMIAAIEVLEGGAPPASPKLRHR